MKKEISYPGRINRLMGKRVPLFYAQHKGIPTTLEKRNAYLVPFGRVR